jgi:methionyl-tRNA formyltransferase
LRIVLLCATERGLRFLRRLRELCPSDELTVVSFPEDPWEPPFLEAIREEARTAGADFFETRDVAGARMAGFWRSAAVELVIAVSWRYLIPPSVHRRPGLQAVVFHDALLPRYRGFAPVSWAILNGETETGATLFHLSDEVDSGDIIDQVAIPLGPDETVAEAMEAVTRAYLDLLERNLEPLKAGKAARRPQDHSAATYCAKRLPEDNRIAWEWPARRIHDFIRGLTRPYQGAFTTFEGRRLTIWKARPWPAHRYVGNIPGAVAEILPGRGPLVLTGSEPLLLERVEPEGAGEMDAADLLKSIKIRLGK